MNSLCYDVLGVDPSLTHTVAHCGRLDDAIDDRRFEMDGQLNKGSGKHKKPLFDHSLARLAYLDDTFRSFIMTLSVIPPQNRYMFIEGYSMGSKFNREALGELGGVLRLCAFHSGWNIVVVAPTALKKFLTLGGKASKNSMMMHCLDTLKYKATDDDDADAYALMRLGQAYIKYMIGAERRIDPAWKSVFANLKVLKASALTPDLEAS